MTRLLVSVRDSGEAIEAIAGGADIVDIKDPTRGSLGKCSETVFQSIVQVVKGRVPISAALGELGDDNCHPQCKVDFLKLGLSGWRGRCAWIQQWRKARMEWPAQCRAVVVSYADEVTSLAPDIDEIVTSIRAIDANVLLIDTCHKNGQTLLDLITPLRLQRIIANCHGMGVPVALAGSLTLPQISDLLPLEPDWIAVRTAACEGGRLGRVSQVKVRQIADILHPPISRLVDNEKAR